MAASTPQQRTNNVKKQYTETDPTMDRTDARWSAAVAKKTVTNEDELPFTGDENIAFIRQQTRSVGTVSSIRSRREARLQTQNNTEPEHTGTVSQPAATAPTLAANTTTTPTNGMFSLAHKTEAAVIGWPLEYTLAWFYPLQLGFALLFYFMIDLHQNVWFADFFVDTQKVATLAWVIIIALGVGLMIFAVGTFLLGGVAIFRRSIIFVAFLLCTAGYFAPFIFIIPWVNLWILAVILLA